MAINKSANWEKWVHGELIASLQAKNKLPKQHTTASDLKSMAYHNTAQRIFPYTEEELKDYSAGMLQQAQAKIAAASAQQQVQQHSSTTAQQQQHSSQHPSRQHQQPQLWQGRQNQTSPGKAALKARVAALQKELNQETDACADLEAALQEAKHVLKEPSSGQP